MKDWRKRIAKLEKSKEPLPCVFVMNYIRTKLNSHSWKASLQQSDAFEAK